MDATKIRAIEERVELKEVHQVRSFLDLDNYYCIFLKGYSMILTPLSDLLKENKSWNWAKK